MSTALSDQIARHRHLLRDLFDAAVAAAHPDKVLPEFLPPPPKAGRIFLLAGGKAGGSMLRAAEDFYRNHHELGADRLLGIGVARHGYEGRAGLLPVYGAGHPVPDEAGMMATARLLALADQARPEDLALVLLSGGGSANLVAPAGALALNEKRKLTQALLKSGATIGDINTVRKHLSRIKGGRLAHRLAGTPSLTLAISDVPGDDPSTIASGPTVPDPTSLADARAILARHRIEPLLEVACLLADPANETPKPGDPAFDGKQFAIVARPHNALLAAEAAAVERGYEPILLGADLQGEARDIAAAHAREALALKAAGKRVVLISGGELTVTIKGKGRGGPNQEYALALAIALQGEPGIAALAGDTDGTDGGRGLANDPAGALIDATSLARASARGISPQERLAHNDSTGFFEALGDLLNPGPTLTNANDFRAIVIEP